MRVNNRSVCQVLTSPYTRTGCLLVQSTRAMGIRWRILKRDENSTVPPNDIGSLSNKRWMLYFGIPEIFTMMATQQNHTSSQPYCARCERAILHIRSCSKLAPADVTRKTMLLAPVEEENHARRVFCFSPPPRAEKLDSPSPSTSR